MSVAGEVTDASIMEVGRSRPQFQYSRVNVTLQIFLEFIEVTQVEPCNICIIYNFFCVQEELMVIKNLRLSKRRPAFLDNAYNKYVTRVYSLLENFRYTSILLIANFFFSRSSRGVWDPERWHSDRKRSDTPPKEERTGRSDQITENHSKRRSNGDPRDRIRKEQDGIVLSPQRRSFNSGCYVNVNQPPNRRPESPIGKTEVYKLISAIGSFFIIIFRLHSCFYIIQSVSQEEWSAF